MSERFDIFDHDIDIVLRDDGENQSYTNKMKFENLA